MQNKDKEAPVGVGTRREFIKTTATAAAVVAAGNIFKTPVYGQSTAPSTGKVIGANDRIVVGYIGVGGQGMAHVRSQKQNGSDFNIAQAAVCDVSKTRIADAQKFIGGSVKGYDDHRRLLENKDIDAVTIATVDHWHAPCAIASMEAGKHVYCEKPMTRYLDEGFQVHDTVKKTGRVFQIGSQICAAAQWHEAAKLIKAGKIGQLVMGQDSYMRNSPKGEWNYDIKDWCTADDVDWKQWMGNRIKKKVAFNADHYFRWRKYYPYCAGLLGDLFPHRLHPFMLATGNPEFPVRVASIGTKKVHTDRNTPNTPERDVPENVGLLAEFPSGLTLLMTSSTVNEQGLNSMMRGHRGTIYFGGPRIEMKPERPFVEEIEPIVMEGLRPSGEQVPEMEKNWFHCIRTGETPFGNIDLAMRVQTVISLAEMSERLSIMCRFDEKSRKITTGDGKAVKPISYGTLDLS